MWPLNRSELGVSASAVALYDKSADLEIKGTGVYGVAPGPVNLSVFGPNGRYSYGDPYSTRFLNDGSPNTRYNGKGYDFRIDVPDDQKETSVEIFDPDCYNANGSINASKDAIDEMRTRTGNGTIADATTTQYRLYYDNGTLNPSDDIEIGTKSWGADGQDSDMRWVDAFQFDRSDSKFQVKNGNFHLNVKSTAGSSENGFDLRAGPTRTETTTTTTETYIDHYNTGFYISGGRLYYGKYPVYATRDVVTKVPAPDWNPNNGTRIVAEGHLPINFNIDGTTKMALGKVPAGAAGGELSITKFDTDVGRRSGWHHLYLR